MLNHEIILKQLSACKIATNNYQEAGELLKKDICCDHGDFHYYLGLTYAGQGKTAEALDELRAVLKMDPSHNSAKHLAFRLLVNKARKKIKEKDINGLSSIVGLAVELAPDTPEAKKELSYFKNAIPLSHIKNGKREDAAKIWEEELKKHPSNHLIIHNLALLYYWWALDEEAKAADSTIVKDNGKLDGLWRKSISYWVMLLSIPQFWTNWKKQKEDIWNLRINAEDLEKFRETFLEEKLIRVFHDYIDTYKQNGKNSDLSRHEEYLVEVLLEKESARCWKDLLNAIYVWAGKYGLRLDSGIKRYELIRSIQKAEGYKSCFGAVKDCNKGPNECIWSDSCKSDRNRELYLNIPAGYYSLKELKIFVEAGKLIEVLHKEHPDNESIGRLRIYLHPSGFGKSLIILEQRKKPQQTIDRLNKLMANSSYTNTLEFKYVYALALMERGKLLMKDRVFNRALDDFTSSKEYVSDAIKLTDKNPCYRNSLISLKTEIDTAVITDCEKEANKLRQSDKIDEAMVVLQRGMKLVGYPDNKPLRDHLAIFYSDRGDKKLANEKFADARKDFEQALKNNQDYTRAKKGIGTTYNNEGVTKSEPKDSIPLFEKAIEYDPDSDVVKQNLAGAYNSKAVALLNSVSQYDSRYSNINKCDDAANLLKKSLKILNPALESTTIDAILYAGDTIDSFIKEMPESLYKTVIKNLAGAGNYLKILRGY
jgi:tetratricopeptide (TPR) repeat protein